MNKAIVTGATGFLGCQLVQYLLIHGIEVIAIVRDRKRAQKILPQSDELKIIEKQLVELTEEDLNGEEADVLFHLAWEGSTGKERADLLLQEQNVINSILAVRFAKKTGCKKFVGAGTLAEKDILAYLPLDEATPNPVSSYGVAKFNAHLQTKIECNVLGVDHVWAVISNTYGPGNYTNNFVNFATKKMLSGGRCEFTSGEQFYDFVNVTDTVTGLYLSGEYGRKNCEYYLGSGEARKLKDFIELIHEKVGNNSQLDLGAIPFNGVSQPIEFFDISKSKEHLGYLPKVKFCDGILDTIRWLKEQ